MKKTKPPATATDPHADLDYRQFCPRCGELAPLEVRLSAHVPYDAPGRGGKEAVSFNVAGCRACAIEAGELVIAFFRDKKVVAVREAITVVVNGNDYRVKVRKMDTVRQAIDAAARRAGYGAGAPWDVPRTKDGHEIIDSTLALDVKGPIFYSFQVGVGG